MNVGPRSVSTPTDAPVVPWTWIFESYRNVIYADLYPYWFKLGGVLVFSLVFLALSTLLFKRVEPAFAKVL